MSGRRGNFRMRNDPWFQFTKPCKARSFSSAMMARKIQGVLSVYKSTRLWCCFKHCLIDQHVSWLQYWATVARNLLLVKLVRMYSSVLYLVLMLAVACCSALPILAADGDNATLPVATHRSRGHVHDAARRACHRQVCYLTAMFEHFKSESYPCYEHSRVDKLFSR